MAALSGHSHSVIGPGHHGIEGFIRQKLGHAAGHRQPMPRARGQGRPNSLSDRPRFSQAEARQNDQQGIGRPSFVTVILNKLWRQGHVAKGALEIQVDEQDFLASQAKAGAHSSMQDAEAVAAAAAVQLQAIEGLAQGATDLTALADTLARAVRFVRSENGRR